MPEPLFLSPFVLTPAAVTAQRHGRYDLYPPATDGPWPAIVFVHGGPLPADLRPTPREWPVFVGYGRAAAAQGVAGVVLDHRLHDLGGFAVAAQDIADTVDALRADPRIDPDRIAVWAFSMGGLLLADWLAEPRPWLRCVAASYPMMDAPPDWGLPERFRPIEAVAKAGTLPVVVTRVGRERPPVQGTVDGFVAAARAAGVPVRVVEVPDGQHAFDVLDHTEESRVAVQRALDTVVGHLTA